MYRLEIRLIRRNFQSSGPTDHLNEGGIITFTVTADTVTNVDLTIPVFVGDIAVRPNANFVEETTRYLRLVQGESTVSFTVRTIADDVDEDDGVVTASILPDNNYTIKTNERVALVDVWDNDGTRAPQMTIQISPLEITEGETATVVVTRIGGDRTKPLPFGWTGELREIGISNIENPVNQI